MKNKIALSALTLALVFCSACGAKKIEKSINTPEPTETIHIPVIETAAPTPEPVYEYGSTVTVEGKDIVSYLVNGELCVKNSELEEICVYEINTEEKYVPIATWAIENGIGSLYDEEHDHYYFSRAAGNWTYPEGYDVPVLMYHEVQPDEYGANQDTVKLSEFEKQMEYLMENGFTPIWFEDLENIDQIEKPIILTFDDGYVGNYQYVLPVLQKYNFKATVFVIYYRIYNTSWYLTDEQIVELSQTGLVQIQSHTMTHPQLDTIGKAEQEYQLKQSKLELTRLTKQIPYVLAYPYGATTSYINDEILNGTYRFGVKMVGLRAFNTSDEPYTVWRFYPNRSMTIDEYAGIVESAFN